METEEICSVTISSLAVSKSTTHWSEDSHLSVLTERGVYIFEILPLPVSLQPCMAFSRSFIYAPNTVPGENIATNASDWIGKRQREDLYCLLMEGYITPKTDEMVDLVPRIVDVAWSPRKLLYSNKCLLAILTSAGTILILHKLFNEWYPAYDITAFYSESKFEESPPKEYINTQAYRDRIYSLQASAMVWSNVIDEFVYFTVVYRSGNIVVYKIRKVFDMNNIPPLEIDLEAPLELNSKVMIVRWASLSTNEFIVFVGYFDGRAQGIRMSNADGKLRILLVETYCKVVDRIAVTDMFVLSQNKNEINILICKGAFLSLLRVTTEGLIKSLQQIQLKAFSVSGICSLGNDRALMLTETGLMWIVDVNADKLRLKEVKHSVVNKQFRYLGLTHSLNRAFLVTASSPNSIYDHLTIKEPTKVHFFNFTLEDYAPSKLFHTLRASPCDELWDCFELMRIKAAKNSASPNLFPSRPSHFDHQSLDELRITMWITTIKEVCMKTQTVPDFASLLDEPSELQSIIFILTICNYLERLTKLSTLSEVEKTAVNSLRLYLEVYLAGEENTEASFITKRARDIHKKTQDLAPVKIETCSICGSGIQGLPWKTNKCPEGHILPRCTVTFLQLTNVNCKICQICNLTFHPCLDEEKDSARCPYCGVALSSDSRMVNLKSLREKSLSRPRGGLATGLDPEMDQLDEN